MTSHTVTPCNTILLPYRCEANCKPVNASEDVVLSVSGQKDSQAIYYNWYLDNTFQTKVRAPHSPEILHTLKQTSILSESHKSDMLSDGFSANNSEDWDKRVSGLEGVIMMTTYPAPDTSQQKSEQSVSRVMFFFPLWFSSLWPSLQPVAWLVSGRPLWICFKATHPCWE